MGSCCLGSGKGTLGEDLFRFGYTEGGKKSHGQGDKMDGQKIFIHFCIIMMMVMTVIMMGVSLIINWESKNTH